MIRKPWKYLNKVELYGNNHLVPTLYFWELTDKEKKEFDYYKSEEDAENNFMGFRYKGRVYDLANFSRVSDKELSRYADGILNDTFFSGILVKLMDEGFVKVYTFYSN